MTDAFASGLCRYKQEAFVGLSVSTPILTTKLYIPPTRPELVPRPRLIERLNEGLHRKLTLISAPAGFGKTTLVSSWIADLRSTISDLRLGDEKIVNRKS
jgi:LuxR family maltose regulon positive regulatory protein